MHSQHNSMSFYRKLQHWNSDRLSDILKVFIYPRLTENNCDLQMAELNVNLRLKIQYAKFLWHEKHRLIPFSFLNAILKSLSLQIILKVNHKMCYLKATRLHSSLLRDKDNITAKLSVNIIINNTKSSNSVWSVIARLIR